MSSGDVDRDDAVRSVVDSVVEWDEPNVLSGWVVVSTHELSDDSTATSLVSSRGLPLHTRLGMLEYARQRTIARIWEPDDE